VWPVLSPFRAHSAGLPTQVRDSQLQGEVQQIPLSEANREYFADQAERQIASGQLDLQGMHSQVHDTLRRLARPAPYYKRNAAQVCSFFLKGNCTRGATCPYRWYTDTKCRRTRATSTSRTSRTASTE
jgi:pre-mRNA-splicing factor RBM22/SLT11